MGNANVTSYAAMISEPKDPHQETGIYRSLESLKKLVTIPTENKSTWDMLKATVKTKGSNPFLGYRETLPDGSVGQYKWFTYQESYEISKKVGAYLLDKNLAPRQTFKEETIESARSMATIGIFMANCPEWFQVEFAAASQAMTIVPLYDTLGEEAMIYICNSAKLKTVVASPATFDAALKASKHCPTLTNIIVTKPLQPEQEARAKGEPVTLHDWSDLLKHNSTTLPSPPTDAKEVNTICYTSGTTGLPKGVILTHGNVYACAYASTCLGPLAPGSDSEVIETDCHISYLPLAHVFERLVCNICVIVGCQIGCYTGDMMKLMDDIGALNPTVFVSVPRLFNRINDKISAGVDAKGYLVKQLFNWGMDSKVHRFRANATTQSAVWDKVIFKQFSGRLGNRLRFMISGGAPLDPKVHERIQACFCAPLLQGYGMSETMGPAFLCSSTDPVVGHVGGVYTSVEFKLRSVPELNYFADKETPQGELLLRGPSVSCGYFGNLDANLEHFSDGWLCTGDICALLPSNGIKIIDRRKNLFKLAQGEYVAPEKIENALGNSSYVNQIFVHGTSLESFLVALVVVEKDLVHRWATERSQDASNLDRICETEEFRKSVLADLDKTANEMGLLGFEKIKNLRCRTAEFTVDNGLLTPTSKLKRAPAQTYFAPEIEIMYSEGILKY